jgi:hypothetical protein
MVVMNTLTGQFGEGSDACRAILDEHASQVTDPRVRGTVRVLSAHDADDIEVTLSRLTELGEGSDRFAAVQALMWVAHFQENVGDPEGAIAAASRGLERVDPDDGPWLGAMLRVVLGTLHAALGRHAAAAPYLREALPDLLALGDHDDAIQAQTLLAMGALDAGRHEEAARILDGLSPTGNTTAGLVGPFIISTARAELALATGDVEGGLRLYRETLALLHALRFQGFGLPSGLEPWTLYGTSAALTAYARFAPAPEGSDLYDSLRADAARLFEVGPRLDFPVTGAVLHALGAWALLRNAAPVEAAVRLLVLAELFAYTRYSPSLDRGPTDAEAEALAPGLGARLRAELAGRQAPDLIEEARGAVAALSAGR